MRRFLLGALIGAGVALLYAPATGRRTRSLIRDKATRMSNDAGDFVGSKTRHVMNTVEGMKARARQVAGRTNRAASPGVGTEAMSGEPSI